MVFMNFLSLFSVQQFVKFTIWHKSLQLYCKKRETYAGDISFHAGIVLITRFSIVTDA